MKKLLFILLGLTSLNVDANGCGGEYQPATGTCRIIDSSGRNGCLAVAQAKDGTLFFGSTEPGLAEAEALRKCQKHGASQCRIIAPEGCSMPKY